MPEDCSVLDVGCGAELSLGLLAATGRCFRGVGFDASAGAICAAQAMAGRVKNLGSKAEPRFEHLDVRAPWPEGAFQVVSIIDVMHHVPEGSRRSVLENPRAALEPGGLLIYKDIDDRPRWRATANRLHDLVMAREWVSYTPLRDVEAWSSELGIRSMETEWINRLWYGHDLMLGRVLPRVQAT